MATDTLRRREVNFGAVRNNTSNTLTAADQFVANRPRPRLHPGPGQAARGRRLLEISGFSASSSGSQYNAPRNRSAANQPWAAIDGDPETAWMTGSYALVSDSGGRSTSRTTRVAGDGDRRVASATEGGRGQRK